MKRTECARRPDRIQSIRVLRVHRITQHIGVRALRLCHHWVNGEKLRRYGVVVARTQVIEPGLAVEVLACVKERVGDAPGASRNTSVRPVGVGVDNGTCRVGEGSRRAKAVVGVVVGASGGQNLL